MQLLFILLQGGGGSNPIITLLFFAGMFAIMYFFMILPQQKKQKAAESYVNEIVVGQSVVTVGGIHGKVTRIDKTTFLVQIDKMTTVKVERDGIAVEKTKQLATNDSKTAV